MIGIKLYKDNTEDMDRYSDVAVWCNANNAHIDEIDDYYEVVENQPVESLSLRPPSLNEQVQEISEALLTTTITQEETIAQLTAQNEALQAQLNEISDAMMELMFSE